MGQDENSVYKRCKCLSKNGNGLASELSKKDLELVDLRNFLCISIWDTDSTEDIGFIDIRIFLAQILTSSNTPSVLIFF